MISCVGPTPLQRELQGSCSALHQQTQSTTTTLVVVSDLLSGSQCSSIDSLHSQGGWLSIAPKLVPPITLVGPLDSHQLCPFFWVEHDAQLAYFTTYCLFRVFFWFVLAYFQSLNLFKPNSTPGSQFKLISKLFALTVDQSQLSKLIVLSQLIFEFHNFCFYKSFSFLFIK